MKKNNIKVHKIYILILFTIILISCDNKTKNSPSPRIKSALKIISPISNEIIKKDDSIKIRVDINNNIDKEIIRSTLIYDYDTINFIKKLEVPTNNFKKYGKYKLIIKTEYSDGSFENFHKNILLYPKDKPKELEYEVIRILPHDPNSYTQGLLVDMNNFIESSGQYGKSYIRRIDINSGKVIKNVNIDQNLFAEGISIYDEKLYMLTWKNKTGLIFDKNSFEKIREFKYETEGWGLTTIDDKLVMSDGTEKIYFRDPETFELLYFIEVYDNNGIVTNINELEFINNKIYSNIYGKDIILCINYKTGKVENIIKLDTLFNRSNFSDKIDVMNGIAYNEKNNSIFITGKWWPSIFEIKINNNGVK